MTDPLRTDHPSDHGEVPERERDARVESLLIAGLDHYFAGQHELAISVWTRVLFLDRGHARAKAYIDRARSAIAERQREGDELVQAGVAAWFGSVPAVPGACKDNELLGSEGCVTNGSENFDKIKFWRTPVAKCESQNAGCVPYYRWVSDYIAILGGR